MGRPHLSHFRLKELALARYGTCGDFEASLAIQGVPDQAGLREGLRHALMHEHTHTLVQHLSNTAKTKTRKIATNDNKFLIGLSHPTAPLCDLMVITQEKRSSQMGKVNHNHDPSASPILEALYNTP